MSLATSPTGHIIKAQYIPVNRLERAEALRPNQHSQFSSAFVSGMTLFTLSNLPGAQSPRLSEGNRKSQYGLSFALCQCCSQHCGGTNSFKPCKNPMPEGWSLCPLYSRGHRVACQHSHDRQAFHLFLINRGACT